MMTVLYPARHRDYANAQVLFTVTPLTRLRPHTLTDSVPSANLIASLYALVLTVTIMFFLTYNILISKIAPARNGGPSVPVTINRHPFGDTTRIENRILLNLTDTGQVDNLNSTCVNTAV